MPDTDTDTRTYTAWLVHYYRNAFITTDLDHAQRYYGPGSVSPLNIRLTVGQEVRVHAYGRLRTGRVVKLNRKRFVVDFVRNLQGEHDTRSFGPTSLDPDADYS
jgi:hypothetical protein